MKTVEDALKDIFDKHGMVTPSLVVEAAKDAASPLHEEFMWDDADAAAQFRLIQARKIIRKHKIVYEGAPVKFVHVPRIKVPDDPSREGSYLPITMVVRQQSMFERALDEALQKLAAAERAVADLQKAAAGDAIDDAGHLALALKSMTIAAEALRKMH
jgi:hypothetical protein